jgi:hypothetical protein
MSNVEKITSRQGTKNMQNGSFFASIFCFSTPFSFPVSGEGGKKRERSISSLSFQSPRASPDPMVANAMRRANRKKKEEKFTLFYPARSLIQSGKQHGRKQQLSKKMLHPTMQSTNHSTSSRTTTSIAGFLPFNPSLRQRRST